MNPIMMSIKSLNDERTVIDLTGGSGPKAILSHKGRKNVKVIHDGVAVSLADFVHGVKSHAKYIQGYESSRLVIKVADSAIVPLAESNWNIDTVEVI